MVGALPVRVAGGARPDGAARRHAAAGAVERLASRAVHRREPRARVGLGEATMTEIAGGPMLLNLDELVWPGRHQPVFAANGIVATSQPLAAGVGVEILPQGGNALGAA